MYLHVISQNRFQLLFSNMKKIMVLEIFNFLILILINFMRTMNNNT